MGCWRCKKFLSATCKYTLARVMEKKQGLWVVKDMVRHLHGTRRGVTDNFFTCCELANSLLTKNMTVVGTLRKNKPKIPALFLSGKTKRCPFFYVRFYQRSNTGTLCTSKKQNSSSFHHSITMTCAWEGKKITNLKSSCTTMPLKVGLTF